jgi:enoyl-CoA hydratase/carnithine racemase
LTLDNPECPNARNPDAETQYAATLDRAANDPQVRAIVVTGAGASFCPGLDCKRLGHTAGPTGLVLEGRRSQHHALTIPKPMVAAICRQVWDDLSRGYTEANVMWLTTMRAPSQTSNPDFAEGVAALVEKRPPNFVSLPEDAETVLPPLPPFVSQ